MFQSNNKYNKKCRVNRNFIKLLHEQQNALKINEFNNNTKKLQ